MLRDVFVWACGQGVFPGVGFMVMGSGCLSSKLLVAKGRIGRHGSCWRGTGDGAGGRLRLSTGLCS